MQKLSIVVLLITSTICLRAQTADEIINKMYDATGGHEKWAKVTSIKSTGTLEVSPGLKAPVINYIADRPLVQYFTLDYQGMKMLNVLQDSTGWSYNPFGGKRETDPMSPDEIRERKLNDPKGILFDYKQRGYTVDYLGTDDIDGVDVYKLRLITTDGDIMYYYIDQQTHYMLKSTTRMRYKDKETVSSNIYSDFRKTEYGITLPYSVQGVDENDSPNGGPIDYTKIEVNVKLDPGLLKKPVGM